MYSALAVADERSFQVNSEWLRPQSWFPRDPRISRFDRGGKALEGDTGVLNRSRDRRRKIAGDATRSQRPLHHGQFVGRGLHHVVAGAAMNMDVNKSGREDVYAEIDFHGSRRDLQRIAATHGGDASVFDHNAGVVNDTGGGQKLFRRAEPVSNRANVRGAGA